MSHLAAVPRRPLRVYLVEDNVHVRENLAEALEELAPLRVVDSTADERAAREWLARGADDCDLVIVDLFLRSGSAFGVLETARRTRPAAAVIALGNEATPRLRARCAAAGAERVFDKARDIDLLVSYCSKLAAERGSQPPPH
jgi:DNA-binding NarL/FixJ family response regulator